MARRVFAFCREWVRLLFVGDSALDRLIRLGVLLLAAGMVGVLTDTIHILVWGADWLYSQPVSVGVGLVAMLAALYVFLAAGAAWVRSGVVDLRLSVADDKILDDAPFIHMVVVKNRGQVTGSEIRVRLTGMTPYPPGVVAPFPVSLVAESVDDIGTLHAQDCARYALLETAINTASPSERVIAIPMSEDTRWQLPWQDYYLVVSIYAREIRRPPRVILYFSAESRTVSQVRGDGVLSWLWRSRRVMRLTAVE